MRQPLSALDTSELENPDLARCDECDVLLHRGVIQAHMKLTHRQGFLYDEGMLIASTESETLTVGSINEKTRSYEEIVNDIIMDSLTKARII